MKKKQQRLRVSDDFVEMITEDRKGYVDPEEAELFVTYGSEEISAELERFTTEIKRTNR